MSYHLYRHFDKTGKLLYVGISLSTVQRLKQHKRTAHWFDLITNISIEKCASLKEAKEKEKLAIAEEKPECNLIIYEVGFENFPDPKFRRKNQLSISAEEADKFRVLMKRIGWTQTEFAKRLGTSQVTLNHWFNAKEGDNSSVAYRAALKYLELLAQAINV